jgi:ATP-dependent RNA helicase DDX52/ROK1
VRGQKRKRNEEEETDEDGQDGSPLPEVDFFAPAVQEEKPAPLQQKELVETSPKDAPKWEVNGMGEEECRQLLKSHRLKITLLSKRQTPAPVESSKKDKKDKKKKSRMEAEVVKPKDDKLANIYPRPLTSFTELWQMYCISSRVAQNLVREGYKVPTEVQMGSLPLLLRPDIALGEKKASECQVGLETGLDFMAVAPTGSGKTISFLIPAVNSIMRRRAREKIVGTHDLEAVVLAPTRELAFQIVNEGRKLVMGTALKVVLMKKGMRVMADDGHGPISFDEGEQSDDGDDESSGSENESQATQGPITKADILVTTPMPLLNFLSRKDSSHGPKTLSSVRSLILDEADVLLDPLFLEQTTGIWSACTNPDLQTTFWSATMPSGIENLIKDRLSHRPLLRLVVGLKDTAVPNITHKLIYAGSESGKLLAIRQLLRPRSLSDPSVPPLRPPFLVFTQTIDRAAALESELKYDIPLEAGGPTRIASLHSGLSDSARSTIMRRFRAGEIWVLVTTDVLARGIDFAGVNGVVNYDVPTSGAVYVHRAGRTGRAGREGGVAVTLYTKDDIPYVKLVANVIAASDRQAGKNGEGVGIQKWLLDALPDVSKRDKKRLKARGVESRRSGGKGSKITTRSGYERQVENRKKGAIEGSKRRKTRGADDSEEGEEEEWGGFDD